MIKLWPIFTLRCLASLGGCYFLVGCVASDVAEKPASAPVPVKTVAVTPTQLQPATQQPATVHAYFRTEVRANSSGFVKHIRADIGDVVDAGAELAVIDVPETQKQREVIEARIARLEAEEKRAQAGVDLATARVQSATAKLSEAESQMSAAEASLAASEAEFTRTEDLVQRQSLQNRMLDEIRMRRDSQLASKQAVASSIEAANAEVAVSQAQVTAAEADLAAAQAETEISRRQLEELDVMLGYATLKSPLAGVVTERNVEPGDLVRAAAEVGLGKPLFVISQVDKVRVRIPVPESIAPRVAPGDEVTLTFPSFSAETPMQGKVSRLSGSLDNSTRTMIVEVDMDNKEGKLLPGMFGQATIQLASKVAANMLPARAIRFSETGDAYVYVVQPDQTVSVAQISTGIDDGNSVEVISGVEAGQQVIDSHLKRFVEGQTVTVLSN